MTWARRVMIGTIVAAGLTNDWALAQSVPDVAEVRKTLDGARKEIAAFKAAGGAAGAADHPAIKWDAALWAYRQPDPKSAAATLATVEAVRLLVSAELWDRAHARVASVDADDPAWARLGTPIYEEGIARQDLPTAIERVSRAAAATTNAKSKAALFMVLGRAYRRHGDPGAAIRALETAKAAHSEPLVAEEADGLIYEIKYLSVGVPAPAISAKARNGAAISNASLRGKPVVLVFWGST